MEEEIVIVEKPISADELDTLAAKWFGGMVKGVADLEREILALGGEWHMEANTILIERGSNQEQLWGFNLYPKEHGEAALEYLSLVNIRAAQGNRGMELKDPALRDKIHAIVSRLIPHLGL